MSGVGNNKLRQIRWAGEDQVVVWVSATTSLGIGFTADKVELSNALVIPVDGRKGWTVFGGKGSITGGVRGFYGIEQHDGRWYGYFGGITLEQDRGSAYLGDTSAELYEVDMADGRIRRIARRADSTIDRDWLINPDGTVAASLDFMSKDGSWKIRMAPARSWRRAETRSAASAW
ncbi:hypothetical protein [Flavisphingomonas formosensis]|uniref:hypothetical protein n=1 Tax=Flavisphingomonas formosensis TaxID=861534 RepID=UPI0012F7C48D|nr:hypothetical protein [Sphingomonas formosensis]